MMLAVWLMTTGAHWDALQLVAWAKMMTGNAQEMSMREAVIRTFDPAEMCGICHTVADAKREQRNDPALADLAGKATLIVQLPQEIGVGRDAESTLSPEADDSAPVWRSQPPSPPPRDGSIRHA
ncbi:hypothetical protein [Congregicoccus parvus]|uniref:hypothetical protein n=1 Tax=Congregicoccus parvus TaxID=3081749 RepID=UPI003FA5768E